MVLAPCPQRGIADLIPLMRAEYLEMPGMRLTLAQASRLWNTDGALCALALQKLVEAGFLYRTGGFYARMDCGRRCA
jgi:hypothetical protein